MVLRTIREQWSTVQPTLQLFERVLVQKGIPLPSCFPDSVSGASHLLSQDEAVVSVPAPVSDGRHPRPDVGSSSFGIDEPVSPRDPSVLTDELLGFDLLGNPELLWLYQ